MEQKGAEIFSWAAASFGVAIKERELNLFNIYYEELLVWNEKINLVSIKSPSDIWTKHFLDSLTAVPYITAPKGRLLDIGSGAGFPGIPIKIIMNSLEIFLLESSRKRVSFLKHIIRRLKLEGIEAIHSRIEELMKDGSSINMFDTIISRASFKLPELIKLSSSFLARGGVLIAMKGKEITKELETSQDVAQNAGMIFVDCHDLRLPVIKQDRKIVIYKKNLQ